MLADKLRSAATSSPTYVSYAAVGNDSVVDAVLTIPSPTGVSEGVLLLAFVSQGNSTAVTWSSLNGFTLAASAAAFPNLAVFTKIATASEPSSYDFQMSASNGEKGGVVIAFADAAVNTVGAIGTTTSSNSVSAPAVTTTSDSVVLAYFTDSIGGNTLTTPTGYSPIVKYETGPTASTSWGVFRKTFPTGASTGTVTGFFSGASASVQGVLVSIKGS